MHGHLQPARGRETPGLGGIPHTTSGLASKSSGGDQHDQPPGGNTKSKGPGGGRQGGRRGGVGKGERRKERGARGTYSNML